MYLTLQNCQVYYQKVGKGANLVMLHGWGNDVSSWWGVVDLLKDDFTLWLIDLPGFGRSDMGEKKAFTNLDYAQVIKEFIIQLKIDKPTVIGHSVGGRIAIKLAVNFPEVVDKLILEDAAGIKPKQDALKPYIYFLAKAAKYSLPTVFGIKDKFKKALYQSLESDYLTAGVMRETLTNLLDEDLSLGLKDIRVETLILWGENDKTSASTVDMAKAMYRVIPNSRLEIIVDVGHFPHIDNPAMFVYWVRNFLLE